MAFLYTNSGVLWGAGLLRTALANSQIHLFKAGSGIVIQPSLVLADLTAAEADYTGYADQVVTAWLAPMLNPAGGASIDSGVAQFQISSPYTVPNSIGGGWVQTAGGVLVCAWDYPSPRVLASAGDGFPVDILALFGGAS